MMLKYFKIFTFFILLSNLFNTLSFANCSNLLRLEVRKRLGLKQKLLFGREAENYYAYKIDVLEKSLSSTNLTDPRFLDQRVTRELLIHNLVYSKGIEVDLSKILLILNKSINDPSLIREWASHLYKELIIETYIRDNSAQIRKLELDFNLSEFLLLKVVLDRLKIAGFSDNLNDLVVADRVLSSTEFANMLKDKKLFLDQYLNSFDHGNMIHILHVDFIVFLLKKHQLDPVLASRLYSWFGDLNSINLHNKEIFVPLIDGWESILDSFTGDFSEPEVLNSHLKKFFDLNLDLLNLNKRDILELDKF